jgi:hypothetical protein
MKEMPIQRNILIGGTNEEEEVAEDLFPTLVLINRQHRTQVALHKEVNNGKTRQPASRKRGRPPATQRSSQLEGTLQHQAQWELGNLAMEINSQPTRALAPKRRIVYDVDDI